MLILQAASKIVASHLSLANEIVKLHFLGTTGYHPNNNRQTACLMMPEIGVIFDAGTGMFRVRDLIETKELDIFMSHVHLDHCVGLTFMYDVLHGKSVERASVHLEGEKIKSVRDHLYATDLFPVEPNFEMHPLVDKEIELSGGGVLTYFPMRHPGGSLGFRIDFANSSMAYVTDTTASENEDYVAAIAGVDTLIHECYFPDGHEDKAELTGHSCLTPVAKVAAKADVGRVFLVHVNPLDGDECSLDLDSVAGIFSEIEIAHDELVIDV